MLTKNAFSYQIFINSILVHSKLTNFCSNVFKMFIYLCYGKAEITAAIIPVFITFLIV